VPEARRAEIMDRPDLPAAEAERALLDIARVHRWTGIGAVTRVVLPRLAPGRHSLLDLGTGGGHVPDRLARRASRRGVELAVVGIDRKLAHLLAGRRFGTRQGRVVADAAALPFRDAAFDWSLSTLFFHHFEAAANRRVLAEMRRVVRRAAIVVDLRRSPLAVAAARLVLGVLGVGPVARHDGQLSVQQAWTLAEVKRLLAGEEVEEVARRWPFRFSLVLPPRHAVASG
jgi:SAM-dependent methyltransferase